MVLALLLAFSVCSGTTTGLKEKDYQNAWCNKYNGELEYRLDDGTRIDCLTDTHAIEFDYAKKWAEATGQSLYYAMKTGKQPGIVIILESEKDHRYIERIEQLADKYGITVWQMTPSDVK